MQADNRLPHTKLLRTLSRAQLLIVWKDVLYLLKNTPVDVKHSLYEHYVVYAMITFAYLKQQGSNANESNLSIHYGASFSYLNKFDRWVNTSKIVQLITEQQVCNDNTYNVGVKYIEKLLGKQESKGTAFNDTYKEVNKEQLIGMLNDTSTDKKLTTALLNLLRDGDMELTEWLVVEEETDGE